MQTAAGRPPLKLMLTRPECKPRSLPGRTPTARHCCLWSPLGGVPSPSVQGLKDATAVPLRQFLVSCAQSSCDTVLYAWCELQECVRCAVCGVRCAVCGWHVCAVLRCAVCVLLRLQSVAIFNFSIFHATNQQKIYPLVFIRPTQRFIRISAIRQFALSAWSGYPSGCRICSIRLRISALPHKFIRSADSGLPTLPW